MITATASSITWLLENLYEAKRDLASEGNEVSTFVLLTKNAQDRDKVGAVMLKYLADRYGLNPGIKSYDIFPRKNSSTFCFGEYGFQITLIDIKSPTPL